MNSVRVGNEYWLKPYFVPLRAFASGGRKKLKYSRLKTLSLYG